MACWKKWPFLSCGEWRAQHVTIERLRKTFSVSHNLLHCKKHKILGDKRLLLQKRRDFMHVSPLTNWRINVVQLPIAFDGRLLCRTLQITVIECKSKVLMLNSLASWLAFIHFSVTYMLYHVAYVLIKRYAQQKCSFDNNMTHKYLLSHVNCVSNARSLQFWIVSEVVCRSIYPNNEKLLSLLLSSLSKKAKVKL